MDTGINHHKMVRAAKKRAKLVLSNGDIVTLVYWPMPQDEYRGDPKKRHGSKPVVTLCNTDTPESVYITIDPSEIEFGWYENPDGTKEEIEWN